MNRVEKVLEYKFFTFQSRRKRIASFFKKNRFSLSEEEVMYALKKVVKSNPKERSENEYDVIFGYLIPVIERHEEAIAYMNTYGHLCETFVSNLKSASLAFETKMIDKYGGVFYRYIEHHKLAPETFRSLRDDPSKKTMFDRYVALHPF